MKAKEYAKQVSSDFEGKDVSIGSEGEKAFMSIASGYVMDLMKESKVIMEQRKVYKNESAISIIKEQEQKWKSFQSNLSSSLKELVNLDTFKMLFTHTSPDLAKSIWPTVEQVKKSNHFKPF